MTCRALIEFLADYLAGDLPAEVRRVFEAHLGECPECVTYLRGYADTVRLARASAETDAAVAAAVPARPGWPAPPAAPCWSASPWASPPSASSTRPGGSSRART